MLELSIDDVVVTMKNFSAGFCTDTVQVNLFKQ